MFQAQEQAVEVTKEEVVEIVELSEVDLAWIGGGTGPIVNTDW